MFKKLNFLFVLLLLSVASTLSAQGFIRGKVMDESGELPGVGIVIKGATSTTVITDVDGTFNVQVTPGKYKISINSMGYRPVEESITVAESETKSIDFTLVFAIGGVTQSVTLVEQSVLDAPATVHVISHEQIIERGYLNIQDVLDDIPEVEIQKKSMVEIRDNIGFRGVTGNEKFLILLDGIRISAATGDPHSVGQNYSVINAERVEVVIGPASAVYGVDAFSGVINIITRKGSKIGGTEIYASLGSFNTSESSLTIGGSKEDFSFSVSGSISSTDEPNFPEVFATDYAWYNEQYLNNGNVIAGNFTDTISIATQYPDRSFNFGTNAYFLHAKANLKDFEVGYMRNGEMHSSSTAARPAYSLFTEDARYGFGLEVVYGRHTFKSENEKLQVQSTLSLNSFETNPNSLFRNVYTNYEAGYKYQFGKTKKISEQIDYKASDKFNLVAGFSYEDVIALPKTGDLPKAYDRKVSPELQGMYYLGTNQTDSAGNDLSIAQDFYFLEYQNIGGFAQAQIQLSSNLEATLGARYDYNTRYGTSFNPRLGVVFKPTSELRLKVMYGESFLSPSPWKAFSHYGAFIPTFDDNGNATGFFSPFFHLPNPDLKPEKLRNFEFSSSYIINKNIVLSVDVFYNELENLINYFTMDTSRKSFQGIPVFFVETPRNQDAATTFGGTLGISATQDLSNFKLNYYAYYTFMDGEFNGEQLPYTAKNTIKAGITLATKRFSVSPRMIYRSTSYSQVKDSEGNYIGNEGFVMLNLNANITVVNNDKFKLNAFLRVNNLLNSQIYHVSNIGSEGFVTVPQDPIKLTFGLSAGF
jgi:iron complex outermembrane receptor protein